MIELPMTGDPSQEFAVVINNSPYLIRIKYNPTADIWTLDINTVDDYPLLLGVPMVLGSDLLSNGRVMEGKLFMVDYNGSGLDPTGDNLIDYGLVWSIT